MGDYHFDPDLACKIGVDEAIVTHNLVYWITKNIANRKHFYDNKYWTYNSVRAFTDLFPFWTSKQLRRIMESLYNQNVVIKGNYNKLEFDKTGWYAISDQYNYLLPIWANDVCERANGQAQNGEPIPNSKPNSNNSLPIGKEGSLPFSEEDLRKRRKKFIPPTLEEVLLIIKEKKRAQKFINHYQGNGWIVGRVKMVDWRATAHNWVLDQEEEIKQSTNGTTIIF